MAYRALHAGREILRADAQVPSMSNEAELTQLLDRAARGDAQASAAFFRAAYAELKRLAGAAMRGERDDHLLQPTALVNEAFLRLCSEPAEWDNRRHFFGAAARSMRQILVDQARRRDAEKRGGGVQMLSLSAAADDATPEPRADVLRLDALLGELEALNPRYGRLVELRYFAGMDIPETADLLGVSPATVKRDWAFARAWLLDRLAD